MSNWSLNMYARHLLFAVSVVAIALGGVGRAEAQTVIVQGQVQTYGQPGGAVQAPAGYGVQGQVYVQPAYAPAYAPTYAPTYAQPRPQIRYEDRETTIKGLWIPGIIIFGVSYALTAAFSSTLSLTEDYATWSLVPLIGPWAALGYATTETETTGSLIGGIAQLAGVAMFVLGMSLHRTVRVATYAMGDDEQAPQLAVSMLPAPGGARLGLTLSHF